VNCLVDFTDVQGIPNPLNLVVKSEIKVREFIVPNLLYYCVILLKQILVILRSLNFCDFLI